MSLSSRVALFFDHSHPHTTGHYMRAALEGLCHVDLFHPPEASKLAGSSHDLYLCIDDSSHYLFPRTLRPSAVWLIDTQVSYRADRIMAGSFDYVFSAQKDGAERLKKDGIASAVWLPVGCAPELYPNGELEKKYDVAFIGGEQWGRRRRLLRRVKERFSKSFIGSAPPSEMGRIYSQSKIIFNDSPFGNLNMRVFEALGSGSCLVTNLDAFGLTDLFRPGVHFEGYSSEDEALRLIERCLHDDAARETIARAGHQEAMARHTYRHRAEIILERALGPYRKDAGAAARPDAPRVWDELRLKALQQCYKVEWHFRKWTAR